MSKFTFSNDGFQAMQQELYQLSNSELWQVTIAVASNFNSWMAQNFELTQSQIVFIESQSPKMTAHLGTQTAFFMSNRLPIILVKPENKINALMRGSKLIRPKSKVDVSSEGEDGFEIDGLLEIEISY